MFLVIPSKVEESLAVFGAILAEIESEMFREGCPEEVEGLNMTTPCMFRPGLIPRDK
jgi:hypothetical protein